MPDEILSLDEWTLHELLAEVDQLRSLAEEGRTQEDIDRTRERIDELSGEILKRTAETRLPADPR